MDEGARERCARLRDSRSCRVVYRRT